MPKMKNKKIVATPCEIVAEAGAKPLHFASVAECEDKFGMGRGNLYRIRRKNVCYKGFYFSYDE